MIGNISVTEEAEFQNGKSVTLFLKTFLVGITNVVIAVFEWLGNQDYKAGGPDRRQVEWFRRTEEEQEKVRVNPPAPSENRKGLIG